MAQIRLSDAMAQVALAQSQAAGFGDDVNEYVSQLIWINYLASVRKVPSPRSHEELIKMLDEGIASGVSPIGFYEQLASLRTEIPTPRNEEELAEMLQEGIDSGICPIPGDEMMDLLTAGISALSRRKSM